MYFVVMFWMWKTCLFIFTLNNTVFELYQWPVKPLFLRYKHSFWFSFIFHLTSILLFFILKLISKVILSLFLKTNYVILLFWFIEYIFHFTTISPLQNNHLLSIFIWYWLLRFNNNNNKLTFIFLFIFVFIIING